MNKFQTNAAGNIDSGTEVLANNLTYMQNGTERLFSDLFKDVFTTGILNTNDENTMFPLTANNDGTFNIGQGIGYIFDTNDNIYRKIAITTLAAYNSANPIQTTPDGSGTNVLTPKSSGCQNIPIANVGTYWIDLQYLQICENGNTGDGLGLINYSIAKKISSSPDIKRFYQWADGYNVILQNTLDSIKGICLGTVTKTVDGTIVVNSSINRTPNLMLSSSVLLNYLQNAGGLIVTDNNTLAINVDNETTELVNNYLQITSNALYPFSKFNINNCGVENFLNYTTTTIGLNSLVTDENPLILVPAYNNKYSVSNNTGMQSIDVQDIITQEYSAANGQYTVCINNTAKTDSNGFAQNNPTNLDVPIFEIMKKVYIGSIVPTSPAKGDIWLDLSTEPYFSKWYDGNNWYIYHGIPLAELTINSTLIEQLSYFPYSQLYKQNLTTEKINLISGGKETGGIIDFHYGNNQNDYTTRIVEDQENSINIVASKGLRVNGNVVRTIVEQSIIGTEWYTIYSDGWVEQGGCIENTSNPQTVNLHVPMGNIDYYCNACYGGLDIQQGETNKNIGAVATSATSITIVSQASVSNPNRIYWEVKGTSSTTGGIPIINISNITQGDNIINTLYTYNVSDTQTLKIEIGGARGHVGGGGIISCIHTFNDGDIIEIKSINNNSGSVQAYQGIGVGVYCNNSIILVAGGAIYATWGGSAGGSGYNGGYGNNRSGYSFMTNGEIGNSTETTGACGCAYISGSSIAYGGSGYIDSHYLDANTIIISGSQNTGNFDNAYAKISKIS